MERKIHLDAICIRISSSTFWKLASFILSQNDCHAMISLSLPLAKRIEPTINGQGNVQKNVLPLLWYKNIIERKGDA